MAFILLLAKKDSSLVRIIPKFLSACEHREVEGGKLNDCMKSLMKVKETLGPYMLTNMNRIVKQGFPGTISRIQKLLDVNIIGLVEDGVKIHCSRGIYFSVHVLNISSIEMMNSLWENAIAAAPPFVRRKHPSYTIKKKKTMVITSSSPSSPKGSEESLPLPLPLPPPPPPPPASSDHVSQGGGLELMDTDQILKRLEELMDTDDNLYQDSGSNDGMLDRNAFCNGLGNFYDPVEYLQAAVNAGADDN